MERNDLEKLVAGAILAKCKYGPAMFNCVEIERILEIELNKGKEVIEFEEFPAELAQMTNEVLWDMVFEKVIIPARFNQGELGSQAFTVRNLDKLKEKYQTL